MGIKIIICIVLLLLLAIAIAMLLFTVAGLLFGAPALLCGQLRAGIAVCCILAGVVVLLPILILAGAALVDLVFGSKGKKQTEGKDGPYAEKK